MSECSTCPACGFNHYGDCVSSEEEIVQRELEKIIADLQFKLGQAEGHNHDLVVGTEYLTKRLGQEVEMADTARKEVARLREALEQILVVWTQPGRNIEERLSVIALMAKFALRGPV